MNAIIKMLPVALLLSVQTLANDSTVVKKKIIKEENGGITLPKGFKAVVVADNLGTVRHIVAQTNGDIYAKLDRVKNGKGILRLRDTNKDGVADEILGWGNYSGTGITIKNGYLYASSNTDVYRYKLDDKGDVIDTANAENIVTGLINRRTHNTKSIVLDNDGNIYVNIGAPSNACQLSDRTVNSPSMDPCPLLDSTGGIWQFKADQKGQSYHNGIKYATGIRNVVGLDWNQTTNQLYAMQHGRDLLNTLFPGMYNEEQSAELPSEELLRIKKGDDYGWPYCYYDQFQKKKVLAPEYGGDGKKLGRCADKSQPIYGFPGHWAPNALLFYTGNQFPEKYKNGAFVAFHGSWNRAPRPQNGYFVVFLPFKDGMPGGDYEIFADGFAGEKIDPKNARFRPCGLAQGPDGSLYISEDKKGRIWKVSYNK
ncbi:sorbosone dehydrogenase [Pseudoflavitalea sp. G-6-1-2]|uniref:PQQ-dependent sugar dehydrogenase n=1 Tax=Pseudoflavitalea sp. G-6-1-2 TaxID=2728841 RepID=UPI00146D130C|nr:PQQ-dependent sugar dehydrogenase [Pseudoflavitalea sp. G-6-1-2]NML23378.1 sorbosone dehydrogenase [Pseudoflavitalea sp. G-6-1-2]